MMLLILFLWAALASPTPVHLPGVPRPPTFKTYSGYVTVDAAAKRQLFYVFSESQRSPASDPVVLWLTGGPGCSSMIAYLSENGPYRPDPKDPSRLVEDDYSWNRVASIIHLESPAGVGFSRSGNPSDYIGVGDARTANDTFAFLQTFFRDLFPQYRPNEFYVTGESYGGHYVPTASLRVIEGNERKEGVQINIKGMIEGNAWTNMPQDNEGALDTWVERAIAPRVLVDAVKQHCNLSYVGPLHKRDNGCNDAINAAMSAFDHVDIYDIYADVCIGTNPEMLLLKQMAKVSWFHARLFERIAARAALKNTKKRDVPLPPVDPCIDNHLSDYLNLIQVQRAINAVPQSARQPVAWSECSSVVQYDFSSVATSVVPVLEKLFARPDFHSLVLSGDVDAIVPVSGTLLWIESLNRTVIKPWHVWLDQDGQAGGFATVYDGFTFTTVRNAGHMVPMYQPARSFQVFSSWLANHTV